MAILSKRIMAEVSRTGYQSCGFRSYFLDLSGKVINADDPLATLAHVKRKRDYALQESVNRGAPYIFAPAPGISTWVFGLEDRRMIHGGLMGAETLVKDSLSTRRECLGYLTSRGISTEAAKAFVGRVPFCSKSRLRKSAECLQAAFYQISGWKPDLMEENRLKALQQEQIHQAIEDQKKTGKHPLYAFEKERALLANIRAGDRNGARRLLNEMLAAIYMSSPSLVVLRARSVELMSYLTRAAIEDNPLMEPLIERNHAWTERLVRARNFEDLSHELMYALDDFIDGIYLHGVNRSNTKVRKALDFISANFARKIALQAVADEVGLSACRLAHLVKQFTGRTVLQILREVRIHHAQQILERTEKSCADVAYEVGFTDQSYFIKHFKRHTGTTPARYRRSRYGNA